jgi:hypothetical protein
MLRRVLSNTQPHYGPLLRFDVLGSLAADRRTYPLWRPLLLLSLFDNPVLRLWARYQVEPGRTRPRESCPSSDSVVLRPYFL